MPLQIAPGTAPEPSFDHLAVLAKVGAQHIPGGVHPTKAPAAAHRRQGELTSELTDSLDNLAKHFDALAKAGFKGADPREITKLLKGLHSDVRNGRAPDDNARKATEEVDALFHELSNEFHFMSDEQKQLTDKLMKHLTASEKLTESLVKRSSRPGKVAGALAQHAGLGDYFDAAFKPRKARAEDDYQSTFARLARVAAGNRGLGNIYDAAFKGPAKGRVARAVTDRPDHVPAARPAKLASATPATPSTSTAGLGRSSRSSSTSRAASETTDRSSPPPWPCVESMELPSSSPSSTACPATPHSSWASTRPVCGSWRPTCPRRTRPWSVSWLSWRRRSARPSRRAPRRLSPRPKSEAS